MKPTVYFPVDRDSQQKYWPAAVLDRLRSAVTLIEPADPAQPWADMPADTAAVVVGWGAPNMPRRAWESLDGLKLITIFGGSANYIEDPIDAIEQRGITLANVAREIGEGVAEETLALMLAAQFDVVNLASLYRRTGTWSKPNPIRSRSITGSTIGLIGFGFVGRHVAKLLAPFEPRLLICDPYAADLPGERVDLDTLMAESDIISLHAGWTKETERMIGVAQLDRVRPGTLIVCTARVPIFDQPALAERVARGDIRLASDLIPFDADLWGKPAVHASDSLIAMPSITSVTGRTVANMAAATVTNIEQALLDARRPDRAITADWIRRTT
jgi:phosphoglycerate dehydrogenase-like enzyme